MLCRKNVIWEIIIGEVHILRMAYFIGCLIEGHVLQVKMFYRKHVLQEGLSYREICLTGGHVI